MRRRLSTLLSAASLAVLLLVVVNWVGSASYDVVRVRWSGGRLLVIGANAGVAKGIGPYSSPGTNRTAAAWRSGRN